MLSFKDQLDRTLQLQEIPKRIVSLVPSQTELLVDLGLEKHLVGITKFCIHPEHLRKEKTIVGGTKQVHFDKIKDLKPDIILCNKEENTLEMVTELERVAPVHLSDIFNLEDSLELVQMYGALFDKNKEAEHLIQDIETQYDNFKEFIAGKNKLKVAYFIWKKPWMVAASQNFIDTMLRINNFENVFGHLSRYPEIELPSLKALQPELILLSSEPFPFKHKDVLEFEQEFPNTQIRIVDGEAFSWYGSRLLHAFDYFKTLRNSL